MRIYVKHRRKGSVYIDHNFGKSVVKFLPICNTSKTKIFIRLADDAAICYGEPKAKFIELYKLNNSKNLFIDTTDVFNGIVEFQELEPSVIHEDFRKTSWANMQLFLETIFSDFKWTKDVKFSIGDGVIDMSEVE